jgi:hypothetical protein
MTDGATTGRVRWFRRPWALEAASAAAVAFVLIGYALFSATRAPVDDGIDLPRSAVAIAVVKPTSAAQFDRTFAWQRIDTATTYRVVVFTATGDRLFELRDLKAPSVKVDESVKLTPGRYLWQVIGFRDGVQVAESPMTEFAVLN